MGKKPEYEFCSCGVPLTHTSMSDTPGLCHSCEKKVKPNKLVGGLLLFALILWANLIRLLFGDPWFSPTAEMEAYITKTTFRSFSPLENLLCFLLALVAAPIVFHFLGKRGECKVGWRF